MKFIQQRSLEEAPLAYEIANRQTTSATGVVFADKQINWGFEINWQVSMKKFDSKQMNLHLVQHFRKLYTLFTTILTWYGNLKVWYDFMKDKHILNTSCQMNYKPS